jgi:sec-independent protein translocase protein TatC
MRLRRLDHEEQAELVEHLGELRTRLVVSLVAVGVGFAVAYVFHGTLLHWLNAPLPDGHRRPVTFGVTEPFMTSFKVSLYAGFALALPVVLWQLWAFLAPAFQQNVQRTLATSVASATALFALGVGFGYRVVLGPSVHFLTTYDSHLYDIQIRASSYYSFVLMVLVAVGIVFELPVFMVALVRLRVVSSATLRRKRRLGYVLVAALAVALPGIDPVTTTLEMVPMLVLFEGSIWLSVILERRWVRAARSPAVELAA